MIVDGFVASWQLLTLLLPGVESINYEHDVLIKLIMVRDSTFIKIGDNIDWNADAFKQRQT
jgi:hypothetical protein